MSLTLTGQWARGLIDLPPSDHPARYSTEVLLAFDKVISEEADRVGHRLRIWDPMAGVGRIHRFTPAGHMVVASELEPEWAQQSPERVVVADATRPPFRPDSFNVVACSSSYGNRMADHHDAKDPCNHRVNRKGAEPRIYSLADCPKCKGTGLSPRNTYRHKLGRMPTRGSDSVMPWGEKYRRLHSRIMEAALGPLVGGGLVVWNTSNHLATPRVGADQVEQRVNEWHLNEWMRLGCNVEQVLPARTRRNRNGRNGEVRVDRELVAVLRAPLKAAVVMLPTAEPGAPIEQVRVAGGVL